jgi:hypothetical protein
MQVISKHSLGPSNTDSACCFISKAFRGAIQLCFQGDRRTSYQGKAWNYYQHVLELVESHKNHAYPEMELLWLMTKAWNHGIYQYR